MSHSGKRAREGDNVEVKQISEKKEKKIISETPPTLDFLLKLWTDFAPVYQQYGEVYTAHLASCVGSSIHLEKATRILEVGCGTGGGTNSWLSLWKLRRKYFSQMQNDNKKILPECKFVITDYTPRMLEQGRASVLETHADLAANLTFQPNVNSEELPFPNASFSHYIANLCLHLIPNPDKMLVESYRILQSGGIAGFSVWGLEDKSQFWSLFPKVLKQLNLEPPADPKSPPMRSNFHLGQDDIALHKRVKAAGYRQVTIFHQPVVMELLSAEAFTKYLFHVSYRYTELIKNLDENQRKKLTETLIHECQQILDSGEVLGFEAVVIIAIK